MTLAMAGSFTSWFMLCMISVLFFSVPAILIWAAIGDIAVQKPDIQIPVSRSSAPAWCWSCSSTEFNCALEVCNLVRTCLDRATSRASVLHDVMSPFLAASFMVRLIFSSSVAMPRICRSSSRSCDRIVVRHFRTCGNRGPPGHKARQEDSARLSSRR